MPKAKYLLTAEIYGWKCLFKQNLFKNNAMPKKSPESGKKKRSQLKSGNEVRIEKITKTHDTRRSTNVIKNML